MAFRCIKGGGECIGCMSCKPSKHYYCPICGKEVYDTVFVDNTGEVIGCENCAQIKEPHEVLEYETN